MAFISTLATVTSPFVEPDRRIVDFGGCPRLWKLSVREGAPLGEHRQARAVIEALPKLQAFRWFEFGRLRPNCPKI